MEQETKKSNKRILIIVAVIIFIAILSILIIIMQSKNGISILGTGQDELINATQYTYGNSQINHCNNGKIAEDEDYIYYSTNKNDRNNYYLFKKSKKDNDIVELTSAKATFINLYKDEIFYINENEHSIFKMNKDGSNRERIKDNVESMYIINDYIYYISNESFHENIYRYGIKDEKTKIILSERISEFNIYNNYIYYISRENKQLYKADLVGKNAQLIYTDKVEKICVIDDKIYVSNLTDGKNIYQISLDGKENKKILQMNNSLTNSYIIIDNQIGIINKMQNNQICLYDMEGNLVKNISLEDLYKNLGLYFPNLTSLGIYEKTIFVDTDYQRYNFINIED